MKMEYQSLPDHFIFSQSSLQAFVDCPRLFQLRYIERILWPAPESEPSLDYEHYLQLGSLFHKLVQQYYLGVNPDRLALFARNDPLLYHWWENFLKHNPKKDSYLKHTEISLSTPLDQYRLLAKFDLLFVQNNLILSDENSPIDSTPKSDDDTKNVIIFDWKTSKKLPDPDWMASRLQSRVYPYVLAKAGSVFTGNKPVKPEQIEMVYWFSNYPTDPFPIDYSQGDFEKDEAFFKSLIEEIKTIGAAEEPKTKKESRCRYCVYRSLCNRGIEAGPYLGIGAEDRNQDDLDDLRIDFDYDQIAEIEF
jgi:RecB family exonuclease